MDLNVREALDLAEELILEGKPNALEVILEPPDAGQQSDADSGESDDEGDPNRLTARELHAPALLLRSGRVVGGPQESPEVDDGATEPMPRRWRKRDIAPQLAPINNDAVREYDDASLPDDPVALFELFFNDTLLELIVRETNRYAAQSQSSIPFRTDAAELRCFISILLLTGYAPTPQYRQMWEADSELCSAKVKNAMRRNRFTDIKRFIHFIDNAHLDPNDKFTKVRPLFEAILPKFRYYAPLQQQLSVDESMIPFYGRHGAKQFIAGKPIRFGFKMWALCTPSGYLINFEPYQGARGSRMETDKRLGVGGSVVMRLVDDLPKQPFVIYADRFFSSVRLAEELLKKGIYFTGTVRSNRVEKCPLEDLTKSPRGTYDFKSGNGILVTKWKDSNVVMVLSTADGVKPVGKADRYDKNQRARIKVDRPNSVAQYNAFMGGVDQLDRNISLHRVAVRSRKWYWCCFVYILETAVQNAWQLYRLHSAQSQKGGQLQFRRTIVQAYLNRYGKTPESVPRSRNPDARAPGRHIIVHLPGDTRLRCAKCHSQARYMCSTCNVTLHIDCFAPYHE